MQFHTNVALLPLQVFVDGLRRNGCAELDRDRLHETDVRASHLSADGVLERPGLRPKNFL